MKVQGVYLAACPHGHIHLRLANEKNEAIAESVLTRSEAAKLAERLLELALPEDARETVQ